MQAERGFRDKLGKYLDISRPFTVEMSAPDSYNCECWCIDESGATTEHALSLPLNLAELPSTIAHVLFTVSTNTSGTMREISSLKFSLGQVLNMSLSGEDFHEERAIVCAELYRKNGEWRFSATASGFNGGLSELLRHYGGQEAVSPPSTKPVELRKGQKVQLEKPSGEIIINLNWHKGQSKGGLFGGLFGRSSGAIDLDLGCLYELKDGRKGSVQALGRNFGSLDNAPYVALDGDDRTGSVEGGENLRVNGSKIQQIRRLLVYTFIYEGIANWREADGIVTVKCPGNRDVIVRMDEYDTREGMCAIAMLENVNDSALSVEKLVRFFNGHEAMDRYYSWGLRWVHGRKD